MGFPQDKVDKEWDKMAGEWDDMASGYANGFYKQLMITLQQQMNVNSESDLKEMIVMDFGAGTGLMTDKLQKHCQRVVAIETSTNMFNFITEKLQSKLWVNVLPLQVSLGLAHLLDENAVTRELDNLEGKVDFIVASSVLQFIPEEDLENTMKQLSRFLKPGGLLIHSDWPSGTGGDHTQSMSNEQASQLYQYGNLESISMDVVTLDTSPGSPPTTDVFWGVAKKQ